LDGDWVSLTRLPLGVRRVDLRRKDEMLAVRAYSAETEGPPDYGEVMADAVYVDPVVAGHVFSATIVRGPIRTYLYTNSGHGVLAVHASHRFIDGSGKRDYFTREFYAPASSGVGPDGEPGEIELGPPAGALTEPPTDDLDLGPLIGAWAGLGAPKHVAALECGVLGREFTVRAYGVGDGGPVDWGTMPAQVFADGARSDDPPSFLVTFDRDDRRVDILARQYMGVLVIGEYHKFTDGSGRTDFYVRECYRR
jgi:hypothetical protein